MPDVTDRATGGLPATTLTVSDVADAVRYTPRRIRQLVRSGNFPQPIDATLAPVSWRWSATTVAAYLAGEWVSS